MTKVTFVSNVNGSTFGKGRKRMRGDTNRKPEIKSWDPLKSPNIANAYTIHTLLCNWSYNMSNDTINSHPQWHWNHEPFRIYYPSTGTGGDQRVGNSIFLKYIRIKGLIQSDSYVPTGCRWRISLLKLNPGGNDDTIINTSEYLNMFIERTVSKPSSWTPYSISGGEESIANFDDTESGSLVNYYCKVKDVTKWTGWKKKVIATGYIPPNFTCKAFSGNLTTVAEQPQVTAVRLVTETYGDGCNDYRFAAPLDVKITLNDRIDCAKFTSYYWLIFESDCGCGYTTIGGIPHSSTRSNTGSPVKINFIAKGYFTDS